MKEAMNRSLTASLGLGGDLMSERCPALNPFGAEPSSPNRSQTYWSISREGYIYKNKNH
jgi:hypothetical protein